MWEEQARLLAPSFRVITYDQRGHGKSAAGNGRYIFEDFVDDLFGLLDALHIQKAILCGLSMGGYTALRALERHPERFQGLVLCDTRSEPDSDQAKAKRAANLRTLREEGIPAFAEPFLKAVFAPSSFSERPAVVDRIRQTILANPLEGIQGTLIALATRTDCTPGLSNIQVPTLILVGDQDAVAPPSTAQAMHDRIASSQFALIPGAGHMSNLENPEFFNSQIHAFCGRFRS